MDADSQLRDTLHITVTNAVSRMETLREAADRRCLFHEYKEWLGEELRDEVWAIPSDWCHEWLDARGPYLGPYDRYVDFLLDQS